MSFPSVHFYAYDTSETTDPSGSRHILFGHPAFIKELGSGIASGLNFGDLRINLTTGSAPATIASRVQAVIFRNATVGTTISNMRIFNKDHTALQTDWSILQYATSGIWQPNPIWPSGIHSELTKQVPASQNLFRQDGQGSLVGISDANVSQYIYMNIIVSSDHPLGSYGAGLNSKELKISVIFDYTID